MKNNYVVQINYVDPQGMISVWQGTVIGPRKASEKSLINGVHRLICEEEKCRMKDIVLHLDTLVYSFLEVE
jgi:hypothetical protein